MVALGYRNLLNELLLALVGIDGDVFIEQQATEHSGKDRSKDHVPSPSKCTLHLAADVDWVDEPDRESLNQLLELGFHYRAIKHFIDRERRAFDAGHGVTAPAARPSVDVMGPPSSQSGDPEGPAELKLRGRTVGQSLYCMALTGGLEELLDVYRAAVLQVEQQVLGAPLPVLSRLHTCFGDFKVLLPQVHRLVYEVAGLQARQSLQVSSLMVLLADRSRCGVPVVESCMTRLLWHCNQVLVNQVASWVVHGVLMDPHGEFFIQPSASAPPRQRRRTSDTGGAAAAANGGPAGEAPAHERPDETSVYNEWHEGFKVVCEGLPPTISPDLAEHLKFIGKAVRLLRNPAGAFQGQQLLPYRDTLEFAKALRLLAAQPLLNRVALERTVAAIRSKVAALLWQLVVVRGQLLMHLAAVKDYFLLAKGEFYHNFLVDARHIMGLPPREATADADVGDLFQGSAAKSTAQHDSLFSLFHLHWSKEPLKLKLDEKRDIEVPRFDENWDDLYLEYSVEWPLGLIISNKHLAKYNALFQFLLRLKRVQLRLEESWMSLRSVCSDRAKARTSGGGSVLELLMPLRQWMAHLVNNLQIYIQVDVIESNYSQLESSISAAQDFAAAERAHSACLHSLMQQSFLNVGRISRCFTNIFRQVQELCVLVDSLHHPAADLHSPAALSQAARIHEAFMQEVKQLNVNLQSSRLQDHNKAPYLRQFLMRINYNGYAEQKLSITSS